MYVHSYAPTLCMCLVCPDGMLCLCLVNRIIRAFLIEEQKIVKKVSETTDVIAMMGACILAY